jgi:histone H3/H4
MPVKKKSETENLKAPPKQAKLKPLLKSKFTSKSGVNNITKSAIKRLLLIAAEAANIKGSRRISGLVYEELKGRLNFMVDTYMRTAIKYLEHSRKVTFSIDILKQTLEHYGEKLYGKEYLFSSCRNINSVSKDSLSSCLFIPKLSFQRFVRESSSDYGSFNFSQEFLEYFQYFIERKFISLMVTAWVISDKIGERDTLMTKDILIVFNHKCSSQEVLISKPKKKKVSRNKKEAK